MEQDVTSVTAAQLFPWTFGIVPKQWRPRKVAKLYLRQLHSKKNLRARRLTEKHWKIRQTVPENKHQKNFPSLWEGFKGSGLEK